MRCPPGPSPPLPRCGARGAVGEPLGLLQQGVR